MRKWELIKQSQILKIKSQILSNLFNEKYGLRLWELKNTTGTELVPELSTQSPNHYKQYATHLNLEGWINYFYKNILCEISSWAWKFKIASSSIRLSEAEILKSIQFWMNL